jgi:type I restriction enzyme M protein
MPNGSSAIVQKLWNYCNVLRDDGMSYGDYVEQLTYLLFLKMADERSKPLYNQKSPIPTEYNWQSFLKKDGDELFDHYRHALEKLGQEKGLLSLIFVKAQNKFQYPAKLRRLIVDLIDNENWSSMSADVKGDAYDSTSRPVHSFVPWSMQLLQNPAKQSVTLPVARVASFLFRMNIS